MATNSYNIEERYTKFLVRRTSSDSRKKWYISHVSSNGATWVSDPLYAKQYSYRTALRHVKSLRASDPNCYENY